jgi:hypothetical protein
MGGPVLPLWGWVIQQNHMSSPDPRGSPLVARGLTEVTRFSIADESDCPHSYLLSPHWELCVFTGDACSSHSAIRNPHSAIERLPAVLCGRRRRHRGRAPLDTVFAPLLTTPSDSPSSSESPKFMDVLSFHLFNVSCLSLLLLHRARLHRRKVLYSTTSVVRTLLCYYLLPKRALSTRAIENGPRWCKFLALAMKEES